MRSKKWILPAVIVCAFNIVPIALSWFSHNASQESSGLSDQLTPGIGISTILHSVLIILAVCFSLYMGNKSKDKSRMINRGKIQSAFRAALLALIVFIAIYFILAFPLVDNRTSDGQVSFINFESISHYISGACNALAVAVISMFL